VLLTISHSRLAVIRTNSLSNGARKRRVQLDWEAVRTAHKSRLLRVMNIPLIKGRTFTKADASSAPPVVIISQSFARRFFKMRTPWSAHNICRPGSSSALADNCGVVGDVRDLALDADPDIEIYAPYQQSVLPYNPLPYMSLVVRTVGDPSSLTSGVLAEIHELDRTCLSQRRTNDRCLLGVNLSATLPYAFTQHFRWNCTILAGVGVYGVISYLVTRRTHEIGVRIALGAEPRNILALIGRSGLLLAMFGVIIGLVVSSCSYTRTCEDAIRRDGNRPRNVCSVSALLIGIVLMACYIPARRAMRVDPMIALRYE